MTGPAITPEELDECCRVRGLGPWAVIPVPERLPTEPLDRLLAIGVGDLGFLAHQRDLRLAPARLLPGARSLLLTLLPQPPAAPTADGALRLAAAYHGRDYHRWRPVLAGLGRDLATLWQERGGAPLSTRACVDSAPVNERSLAHLAGLGWIGRQGLLLHPDLGSRAWIGCLFSAIPLPERRGGHGVDRCGVCRRCRDACPTGALGPDGLVVPRCLSYLTIEHRGVIPRELAAQSAGRWFGCDACQDACPWNRGWAQTGAALPAPPAPELLAIGPDDFNCAFAGSAVRRLGWERFRRNLLVACFGLGRSEDCQRLLDGAPPLVAAQAQELGLG